MGKVPLPEAKSELLNCSANARAARYSAPGDSLRSAPLISSTATSGDRPRAPNRRRVQPSRGGAMSTQPTWSTRSPTTRRRVGARFRLHPTVPAPHPGRRLRSGLAPGCQRGTATWYHAPRRHPYAAPAQPAPAGATDPHLTPTRRDDYGLERRPGRHTDQREARCRLCRTTVGTAATLISVHDATAAYGFDTQAGHQAHLAELTASTRR